MVANLSWSRIPPSFPQELLGGPCGVGWHRFLLEDVVAVQICPLDPDNQRLLQKVLINVGVDSFIDANDNDRTLLNVPAHHSQDYLLQSSLGKGRDADAGLHVSHREIHQVAAVVAVDTHIPGGDHFIGKNPDLIRLAVFPLLRSLRHLSFLIS
jgi:hypothetical protein